MSRLRKAWLLGLGLAILLGAGCQDRGKGGAAGVKRQVVTGVQMAEVRLNPLAEYYETMATVRPQTVSAIAGRVMGVVTAIHVKEGDSVGVGQELLTIDDRDLVQRLKAADAAQQEARKALEAAIQNRSLASVTQRRYKQLFDERAISGQEMDQVNTQLKVAHSEAEKAQAMVARAGAGLAEAQVYLGYARIVSPASGVVTEKKTEVGSMAVPGSPLLTVEDQSAFKLEVNVDESLSSVVVLGMSVEVSIDAIGLATRGQVREIVPAVDPGARSFVIKVGVAGNGLRSGMYARVRIPVGERQAILVPGEAVVNRGQLTGVYKVSSDGIIALTMVRVGKQFDSNVEVLSGLKPGERIIVSGVNKAVDGGRVGEG
jgi:RND family efflux transporter MFP subunit